MVNCWFPDEVMMKILSHLPIKSMVRFRCVCKYWFRLFTGQHSDPYFSQLHSAHSTLANPNPILIHLRDVNGKQLPCNFRFASDYTKIDNPIELKEPDWYTDEIPWYWGDEGVCVNVYGVCNGLVCIKSNRYESDTMYIWNPITRDNIRIPCPPCLADVSDGRNKRAVYGFGFCHATNEYKMVGIIVSSSGSFSDKYDYECRANVLTLGTNTWRAMEDVLFDVNIRQRTSCGVVINEALHWLADDEDILFGKKLISFDLEREFFQEILMPKVPIGDHGLYLEEVSGMLAILCHDFKNKVQIWVMNDYGVQESWTKQFTITRSQIAGWNFRLEPFGVTNDGNIMMRNYDYLLLLNPKTNSIETSKFCQFGDSGPSAYFYKWCLVSPRYITSDDSEQERKTCT